jgi:hypothetical protein
VGGASRKGKDGPDEIGNRVFGFVICIYSSG